MHAQFNFVPFNKRQRIERKRGRGRLQIADGQLIPYMNIKFTGTYRSGSIVDAPSVDSIGLSVDAERFRAGLGAADSINSSTKIIKIKAMLLKSRRLLLL